MAPAKRAAAAKTPSARATPRATSNAAVKTPSKPVAKALVAPSVAAKSPAAKPAKADKPKKPKLVRDSFTIPKTEYAVLDELKQRAAKLGAPAKKSEVLRAGIKALAQMSDVAFQSAMAAVPAIKTGRPGKAD
ncbi:MAG: hypothetical protein KA335_01765 [Ramlibacter sp.]|jgi:hypothetical protein|nr:hypothetical protein [Ramlibacter sp.]